MPIEQGVPRSETKSTAIKLYQFRIETAFRKWQQSALPGTWSWRNPRFALILAAIAGRVLPRDAECASLVIHAAGRRVVRNRMVNNPG
jgi:hypothetical protein